MFLDRSAPHRPANCLARVEKETCGRPFRRGQEASGDPRRSRVRAPNRALSESSLTLLREDSRLQLGVRCSSHVRLPGRKTRKRRPSIVGFGGTVRPAPIKGAIRTSSLGLRFLVLRTQLEATGPPRAEFAVACFSIVLPLILQPTAWHESKRRPSVDRFGGVRRPAPNSANHTCERTKSRLQSKEFDRPMVEHDS